MEAPSPSEFPRPFGSRYVLLKELARGGMGRICLAMVGGRVCAVKTLHPDLVDSEYVRRFLDEATLATRLSHPNLVYVSEAGSEERSPYFAMEYLRGKNLNEIINRCGKRKRHLHIGFVLFIMKEILRGLSYMHGIEGLKLVHRDLALSNIIVTYDGAVKIIDLGLAKWRDRQALTIPGSKLGQRRYLSPEQTLGRPVDARSDIYSAGVIFWELALGRPLERKLDESTGKLSDIPGPLDLAPSLFTPSLNNLIMTMLADDPADRYQNAHKVISELTPMMSAEYESSALQSFLAEIFAEEIRQEASEEETLVANATAKAAAPPVVTVLPYAASDPSEAKETPTEDTSVRLMVPRHRQLPLLLGVGVLLVAVAIWLAFRPRTPETKAVDTVPQRIPPQPVPPSTAEQPSPPPASSVVVPVPVPAQAPPASPRERKPSRPSAARMLEEARDFVSQWDIPKATAIAEQAVKADGNNLEARILLGDIYLKRMRYESALAQYRQALKISPGDKVAQSRIERALAERKP